MNGFPKGSQLIFRFLLTPWFRFLKSELLNNRFPRRSGFPETTQLALRRPRIRNFASRFLKRFAFVREWG